ncbi:MAG: hypothetical protein ABIK96_00790 [bacterium]
MTVQEMIDALSKVQDKSIEFVVFDVDDRDRIIYHHVYEFGEGGMVVDEYGEYTSFLIDEDGDIIEPSDEMIVPMFYVGRKL